MPRAAWVVKRTVARRARRASGAAAGIRERETDEPLAALPPVLAFLYAISTKWA